jgi:hypothetical protein
VNGLVAALQKFTIAREDEAKLQNDSRHRSGAMSSSGEDFFFLIQPVPVLLWGTDLEG